MGLKRLTARAMPTLIIAANLPDIDAVATLLGRESLAIRRGITHGPIALILLPLLLTGIVLLWDRWRPDKSGQLVRAGPLLLLAYVGTLSHPALDWLNSYGIRLLEPFSSRWFYGDTLFIIDVWIWGALILSFWLSRRREKSGGDWRRPAWVGFAAISFYILGNGLITGRAETLTWRELEALRIEPRMVVANPVPLAFWDRRMLWRSTSVHGGGTFRLGQGLNLDAEMTRNGLSHPALMAARDRPDVRAFLFWSRMPIVTARGGQFVLTDQRFDSRLTRDQFLVPLAPAARTP